MLRAIFIAFLTCMLFHRALAGCPAGQYLHDQDTCVPCPKGFSCVGGDAAPVFCSAKHYQDAEGQSTCQVVEPGYYTNTSTRDFARPCSIGHYCRGGDFLEDLCMFDRYQNETGQAECKLVPAGYYTHLKERTDIYECPKGHWCSGGDIQPILCGPSMYQDQTAQSMCKPVNPGYYTNSTTRDWRKPCPTGHHCLGGDAPPYLCREGLYQDSEGCSDCKECPAGSYIVDLVKRDEIAECGAGFYCPGKDVHPLQCANGSYQDETGSTKCKDCSGVLEYTDAAHTSCLECTGTEVANKDHLGCGSCPRGSYFESGSCMACASNTTTVGTDRTQCFDCPANSHTEGNDRTVCVADPGYHGTGVLGDTIAECEAGYMCAGGHSMPKQCEAGTFAPGTSAFCSWCPAGSTAAESGAKACVDVPPGYYEVAADKPPAPCAAGYRCVGSDSQPEICGPMTFSSTASAECLACEDATYSGEGEASCASCKLLSGSSYCGSKGPQTCPKGSYITNDARTECKKCSADYKCNGTDKREFTLTPFSSVDPSTASGFLTLFLIVVLAGIIALLVVVVRSKGLKARYASLE